MKKKSYKNQIQPTQCVGMGRKILLLGYLSAANKVIWGHCSMADWQKIIFDFFFFFVAQRKKQFCDFWKPQVAKALILNRFLCCKFNRTSARRFNFTLRFQH